MAGLAWQGAADLTACETDVLSSLDQCSVFPQVKPEGLALYYSNPPPPAPASRARPSHELFEQENGFEDGDYVSNEPDLNYISKMLGMVGGDFTNKKIEENFKNMTESVASVEICRKTRLNPDSQEFKPTNNSIAQESSVNKLTDIESLKQKLKEVIVKASKAPNKNSTRVLKERNVAMASLQRLASTTSILSTTLQQKLLPNAVAVKLFTPEDFVKPLAPVQEPHASTPSSGDLIPMPEQPETKAEKADHQPEISKYVKEWVQDPSQRREKRKIEKPKLETLLLEQFTFGPKVQNNAGHSTEPSSSSTPVSVHAPATRASPKTGKEWVPPQSVQELVMEYKENAKKQEEKMSQAESKWTKLERELKEKDAIILNKRTEEYEQTQSRELAL